MARDRSALIKIVQDLWRKAENPATPDGERDSLIRKANEMMAKYQIEEMVLNEAKLADNRENIVLVNIRITEDGRKAIVPEQRIALVAMIARYNRVRCVVKDQHETVDDSGDVARRVPGGRFVVMVGFKSDCDFVRELFIGVGMDMMQAMMLEPSQKDNYRQEFCAGFVDRIGTRLAAMEREVKKGAEDVGMGLVLVSRTDLVAAAFKDAFPYVVSRGVSGRGKYDPTARGRGAAAANSSDLGQGKVGGGGKGALGS
jgi:hypothetical protein